MQHVMYILKILHPFTMFYKSLQNLNKDQKILQRFTMV